NIFLEKPMARTLTEADEMIAACETHHVKAAIAHQTRYSPRAERVKELIAAGKLGEILELRGRGKEDKRGGGQDLMVLGTHVMDLMRVFAGDARWCFSTIQHGGKPATKENVTQGGEGMGPILGDNIHAVYGFDRGVQGTFATHRAKPNEAGRFGLWIHGSKGMIATTTGSLPGMYFSADPTWGIRGNPQWQPITSAGVGKPEPLKDGLLGLGNEW